MRNPTKDLEFANQIHDSEIYPICIPSYQRPDATLLYELAKDPNIPAILFIRKEELPKYKKWSRRFKIVLLKDVHNLGETRAAIMRYCYTHGIKKIFMLDDDVQKFGYLVQGETKKGEKKLMIHPFAPEACQICRTSFKLWMYYISLCDNVGLSGIGFRPFSWPWGNTRKRWVYNDNIIGQIFFVDVALCFTQGVNFRSSDICFNEDTCFQFEVMRAGMNTISFREFTYTVPSVGELGGCAEMYQLDPTKSRKKNKEICAQTCREKAHLLIDNVAKDHPGITLKTEKSSGRKYAGFIWDYWRKPYVPNAKVGKGSSWD